MPSYRGRLAPIETAALVEFIKSLRSPAADLQRAGARAVFAHVGGLAARLDERLGVDPPRAA